MSLFRTPMADEDGGGPLHPDVARERGQTLRLTGQVLAMTGDLLPTPEAALAVRGGAQDPAKRKAGGHSVSPADAMHEHTDFGDYTTAVERWAAILGRPAPAPTEPGARGGARLSPAFVEWMMGLPAGHVVGRGLSRAEELRALGNGVVPQQATVGVLELLGRAAA